MLAGSTVLVTGCSRGLGLEMTRQLLTRSVPLKLLLRSFGSSFVTLFSPAPRRVGKVVATCRQPHHAEELGELAEQHPETLFVARFDLHQL